MSWQERPEVDHIFPRSTFGPSFPALINDIGNLAFLGKLRNIRKTNQNPWDYFADLKPHELSEEYLINSTLLKENTFAEFVADRRIRILERVKELLGR
jgi:hypothetical protein